MQDSARYTSFPSNVKEHHVREQSRDVPSGIWIIWPRFLSISVDQGSLPNPPSQFSLNLICTRDTDQSSDPGGLPRDSHVTLSFDVFASYTNQCPWSVLSLVPIESDDLLRSMAAHSYSAKMKSTYLTSPP
jgi:hypothetical protein